MAKLAGSILFTGTMGDVTAYKRHDSDSIILRRKGGPTKKQILKGKKFENLRRNMAEFGGRARATWWLRRMTQPLHACGDTRFTGRLAKLMKTVQEKDSTSELGKRGIPFSLYPKLLEGFNLNRYHPFDSIVRNPVYYAISKDTLSATVKLPALLPGINFINPFKHPYFKISVALGLLPDLEFNHPKYKPVGFDGTLPLVSKAETEWLPVVKGMEAQELLLTLPGGNIPAVYTLALSIGIISGKPAERINGIEQVKFAGAAKIVAME